MKTKDNVQKMITKLLVVVITVVLFGVTVNAQTFWKNVFENNVLQPIVLAMLDKNDMSTFPAQVNKTNEYNAAFLLEVEAEEALEVESWMLNEDLFEVYFSLLETEEPLELEDWMYNENYFRIQVKDILAEKQESLELESWMIDCKIWK